MIAFVLERCGLAPKFQVGGELVDLGTSARWGEGEWMVIEADEFDRRFLEYRPEIAVVTNVEPDHFEYYGSVAEMEGAFRAYLASVLPGGHRGRLRPGAAPGGACCEEVSGRRIVRYGIPAAGASLAPQWDWWASDVVLEPGGSRWTATRPAGRTAGAAARALAAAGAPQRAQRPGRPGRLRPGRRPPGARPPRPGRRSTAPGAASSWPASAAGVRVYEDYAHHPTEVRVNLEAARLLVPPGGRLWAVFQPHLYQRTEGLFDEFRGAFQAADQALLTDVYSPQGREPARAYRGTAELVAAMTAAGHPGARHVPDAGAARATLNAETSARGRGGGDGRGPDQRPGLRPRRRPRRAGAGRPGAR